MGWAKIDDQFTMHPKALRAGNEAVGCWVRLLAWTSAQLTDGAIPREVAMLVAEGNASVIERLCTAGLLDNDGADYLIHDYLDYNPSAAEVRKIRKERAKAGSRGGKQSASKRQANCLKVASTLSKQNPTPSRPVPDPTHIPTYLPGAGAHGGAAGRLSEAFGRLLSSAESSRLRELNPTPDEVTRAIEETWAGAERPCVRYALGVIASGRVPLPESKRRAAGGAPQVGYHPGSKDFGEGDQEL